MLTRSPFPCPRLERATCGCREHPDQPRWFIDSETELFVCVLSGDKTRTFEIVLTTINFLRQNVNPDTVSVWCIVCGYCQSFARFLRCVLILLDDEFRRTHSSAESIGYHVNDASNNHLLATQCHHHHARRWGKTSVTVP